MENVEVFIMSTLDSFNVTSLGGETESMSTYQYFHLTSYCLDQTNLYKKVKKRRRTNVM
jgi:hypothetical protein